MSRGVFWTARGPSTITKDGGVQQLCRAGTALLSLAALLACTAAGAPAGMAAAPLAAAPGPPRSSALLLPCPSAAGWQLVRQLELPRRGPDDEAIGGFSAARFDPISGELLLLSDAPCLLYTSDAADE